MASYCASLLRIIVFLHFYHVFGVIGADCEPCSTSGDAKCNKTQVYQLPTDYATFSVYQPTAVHCPSGYQAVFEHCYKLLNGTYLGKDARNACEEAGGTLAEVKDHVTNGAIYNFTVSQEMLVETIIGVECRDDCHDLITHDNTNQTFTAWEKCEPSMHKSENCVVTNFKYHSGLRKAQWNNIRCDRKHYQAICQVKSDCPGIQYADYGITFLQTEGGQLAHSVENCTRGAFTTSLSKATKLCEKYSTLTSFWSELNITNCQDVQITLTDGQQVMVSDVTPDNVEETSEVLANLANTNGALLLELGEVFDHITQMKYTSKEVTDNVVTAIDALITALDIKSEEEDTSPSTNNQQFVRYLENQITNLLRSERKVTIVTENLKINSFRVSDSEEIFAKEDIGGIKISFPPDLTDKTTVTDSDFDSSELSVTVIEYLNPVLFENEVTRQDGEKLASNIFGIRVEGRDVHDLPNNSPIQLTFPIQQVYENASESSPSERLVYTCSFWDFEMNDKQGGWSQGGCVTTYVEHSSVRCNCYHLSNLCVLVHKSNSKVLGYINQVGCYLSVGGLVLTILFYVLMRKTTKLPQKILLNLSIALLGFYVAFILGIQKREMNNKLTEIVVCLSSAAILHYLVLASMAWMCVEALHMYLLFVKVSKATGTYFLCRAGIFAWVAPIIPVGISLAVWKDDYVADAYCFLDFGQPLMFGFIPVILLMFLFNGVCYVRIFQRLVCSKEMGSSKAPLRVVGLRLMNSVAIWTILGMSWGFGFMSLAYYEISGYEMVSIFDVLFSVTLSLKGFLIFCLFCLCNKEFRMLWRNAFVGFCRHAKQTTKINLPLDDTYSDEKATRGYSTAPVLSQPTCSTVTENRL